MVIPTLWRTKKQRYSLQGEICPECHNAIFPPREVCPYCNRSHDALYARDADNPQRHSMGFVFVLPQMLEMSAAGDD